MFIGHWSSASGNLRYLIYHVNKEIHVTKRLCDFMSRSSLLFVTYDAKFGWNRHCSSWGIKFLICHVISQNLVTKGSCDNE